MNQHFVTPWALSPVPSNRHSQRPWKVLKFSESSTSSSTQGPNENSTAHNNTDDTDGKVSRALAQRTRSLLNNHPLLTEATITHSMTLKLSPPLGLLASFLLLKIRLLTGKFSVSIYTLLVMCAIT